MYISRRIYPTDFGLPPDVVAASLGDLGVEYVAGIEEMVGIISAESYNTHSQLSADPGQHRSRPPGVPRPLRYQARGPAHNPAPAPQREQRTPQLRRIHLALNEDEAVPALVDVDAVHQDG